MIAEDWRLAAACRGMAPVDGRSQPHPFFPDGKELPEAVVDVCSTCPVAEQCDAFGAGQFGVWAGKARKGVERPAGDETKFTVAATNRDQIHREFRRGATVAVIAGRVGMARRSVYRALARDCSSAECWCRNRSSVPLAAWREAAG